MATIYLTHHLYPENPHLFVVDAKKITTLRGEANTAFSRNGTGEEFWKLVIYTSGLDSDGNTLGPYWIGPITTQSTINELINDKIAEICKEIDWSVTPLSDDALTAHVDRYEPVIYWQYPIDGQTNVPIDSRISIRLRDLPPAKGINQVTITMKVNGMEVTPEISGNPYDTIVSYRPRVGD